MKKLLLLICAYFLLSLASAQEQKTNLKNLPNQILNYYKSHNFITLLSTQDERQKISQRRVPARSLKKNERLNEVIALGILLKKQQFEQEIDPGIFGKVNHINNFSLFLDFYEVVGIREQKDDHIIVLIVEEYKIEEEKNFHYVSAFDQQNVTKENFDEWVKRRSEELELKKTHYHVWKKKDGYWEKRGVYNKYPGHK